MIEVYTELPVVSNNLEEYCLTHPHGNFFQSPQTFEFFKSIAHYEPILLVAKTNNEITGMLLAVFIKEGSSVKSYFSRRCIIWGGPLVKEENSNIYSKLLTKLNEIVSKKAIYTEIRNFRNISEQRKLFEIEGYIFQEHLNYIITIPDLEAARKKLSSSKKRQVDSSLKSGAVIVEASDIEEIKIFYNMLSNLYKKKIKKPLPAYDLFEAFFNKKELGRYLLVKYNERIIGGIMCPVYKETIYEWFICGLDNEYKKIYPSVLATWAAIVYAANHSLKYFDFMGAGKPDNDYGVREFKSKFGGVLHNNGRFVCVNNNTLFNIGKAGLKILEKIS